MGCGSSLPIKSTIRSTKPAKVNQTNGKLPPINLSEKSTKNREKNLEALTLICLDEHFDENDKQLRSIVDYIRCFRRLDQCEEYILSIPKNNFVFFIVANEFFTEIISHIHESSQILGIYVLQDTKSKNSRQDNVEKHWTKRYSKVNDFFHVRKVVVFHREYFLSVDERSLF